MTWRRIGGWEGGTVTAIALSPNFTQDRLALAATAAGIFRSTDGGLTWSASNDGLSDPSVAGVEFVWQPGGGEAKAYAFTEGGRLFSSIDGGQAWVEVTAWAGLGQITALAFSPNFAADQTLFAATLEGVFRSQDGGASWESSTFGLHDPQVLCLALAPDFAETEVLWAGAAQGGFYRSRNGGRSWRDSGAGLPDDAFTCLLVSPAYATNQTLYLGTAHSGLFRSMDGGLTWSVLSPELATAGISSLATVDAQTLLAGTLQGILISEDGGLHWRPMPGGEKGFALALAAEEMLLAGLEGAGVLSAKKLEYIWQPANRGLVGHAPPVVRFSARRELIALDAVGLLAYSADEGATWHELKGEGAPSALIAMALDDAPAGTVLYATDAAGGLFAADLSGSAPQWRACFASIEPISFPLMTVLPGLDEPTLLLGRADGALFRWSEVAGLQPVAKTCPWAGATLLHLAHSPAYPADQAFMAVTAQPNAQGNYGLHLWQTGDNGQTWENLAQLESELPSVALAWPHDLIERSILLATRNRVIHIFSDTRGELAMSQSFLNGDLNITAIAPSPTFAQDRQVWLATSRGVYHSADGGVTWTRFGEELAGRMIVALSLRSDRRSLLAVELGGTIWQFV